MSEGYVHGIVIKEGTGEVRAIKSPSPYVIALVGTAPAASAKVLAEETPTVFFKRKDALKAVYPEGTKGDLGTLYSAVDSAFSQTEATVILIKSKSDSDADVISAIGKLEDAESLTGYKPKIIAAPGFGNKNPPAEVKPNPQPEKKEEEKKEEEKKEEGATEEPKPEGPVTRNVNNRPRNSQPVQPASNTKPSEGGSAAADAQKTEVVRDAKAEETISNPIAAKLKELAVRLGAIICQETPDLSAGSDPLSDIQKFRNANGGDRVYLVAPKVKWAAPDGLIKNVPGAAAVAGIFARIDFWKSPSNQELYGVLGTEKPVPFALDDPQSLGQRMNAIQVSTFVRQDGLRLWGARGSGDPTDLTTNQIQKVRIRDAIREAIIASHRWAIAMGITTNLFEAVAGGVNAYLDDLAQKGAIAGGKCIPDTEQNTPANLNDGKVFWTYDFTPTPVAETLHFTEVLTDKYLEGLGAAGAAA
jgi:phage tail sheath protein FI